MDGAYLAHRSLEPPSSWQLFLLLLHELTYKVLGHLFTRGPSHVCMSGARRPAKNPGAQRGRATCPETHSHFQNSSSPWGRGCKAGLGRAVGSPGNLQRQRECGMWLSLPGRGLGGIGEAEAQGSLRVGSLPSIARLLSIRCFSVCGLCISIASSVKWE